ncbi:MAG: MnhB domain-containing protein [Eubacteriales bacterium]|nr:MnhB domain-containing protein [Eubacteriales bacterium]
MNKFFQAIKRWVDGDEKLKIDNENVNIKSNVTIDESTKYFLEESKKEKNAFQRMTNWFNTFGIMYYRRVYMAISILTCLIMITLLLLTVSFLPQFGNPSNPANNEVSRRYITEGLKETGAVNLVGGLILDYRAFDTLGESHVLFCAVIAVIILLKLEKDQNKKYYLKELQDLSDDEKYYDYDNQVLKFATSILFPIIMILGIYIVLNGHLSAGGGFSGGAIMGAGLILYLTAFGYEKIEKFFNFNTFKWISLFGLIAYALLKTYSFYTGANHIESIIPKGIAGNIISSGLILPLNICVGLVVCSTMYAFYSLFRKGDM